MGLFVQWDLFVLVLTIASIGTLGLIVFLNDMRNATNRVFLLFVILTILWGTINYFSYKLDDAYVLWSLRIAIFLAVWHAYSFFLLVNIFPNEKWKISNFHLTILLLTLSTSLLTLTPFVFSSIGKLGGSGVASTPSKGAGIVFFVALILFLVIDGLRTLIKRYRNATSIERSQLGFMLVGSSLTFALILIFNLILPTAFNNVEYIPFGALFILPLVIFTSYAIYKYNLFNLKLVATQLFVGILCVIFFARTMVAPTSTDRIVDAIIFITTVFFGVLLVQSVKKEVRAREEVNKLAKRLTESNWELARTNERLRIIDQRKSEFVSIVSHQLRTPITAIKGYTSMILEESFGAVPETIKTPIEKIFFSSKRLAEMVDDFLDLSKIEQGRMSYNFTSVDIKEMLQDIKEEFTPIAKKKDLALNFITENEGVFIVTADTGKVRQIFTNLIDNAIKYTPEGSITVTLGKNSEQGTVVVRIKDTGIGLSQDDIHHLFGKFTRGEGGQKQYTEGSGLGLYVAKKILEAHHGKIWVDSPGIGNGAEFTVELLDEEDTQSI